MPKIQMLSAILKRVRGNETVGSFKFSFRIYYFQQRITCLGVLYDNSLKLIHIPPKMLFWDPDLDKTMFPKFFIQHLVDFI